MSRGSPMRILAVITGPEEVRKILRHPGCMAEQQPEAATRLVKIGRSPPGFNLASLN